jgi:hypothetical protein
MSFPSEAGETRGAFRPLGTEEKRILNPLLSADFPGREALAAQCTSASGRQIDPNGSLEFALASGPRADVVHRIPVEAEVEDQDGVTVHVLLHVMDGGLNELEIFREDSGPLKRALAVEEFRLIVL